MTLSAATSEYAEAERELPTANPYRHVGDQTSIGVLRQQRQRGFRWLRFRRGLEDAYRRDLVKSGQSVRLTLILMTVLLHFLTPFYFRQLLQVPDPFVGYAYAFQFALQVPMLAVVAVAIWWWPLSRFTPPVCGLAFFGLTIGLLGQRAVGAHYGFDVPSEFTAIAITGWLIGARMRLWLTLPWAMLALAAILLNEYLFVPPSAMAAYHMVANLMLIAVAIFGGYIIEHLSRGLWLDNQLLSHMSRQDGQTDLLNRTTLEATVEQGVHLARREKHSFAVAMVDIDYFKAYNDAYGHREGDTAIRRVADILRAAARRPQDVCGRYGGEEFALLWADGGYAELSTLAEKLRRDIEKADIPHRDSGTSGRLTISIGLFWADANEAAHWSRAATGVPGVLAAQLLAEADALLYRAKEAGRNRVICAKSSIARDSSVKSELPENDPAEHAQSG